MRIRSSIVAIAAVGIGGLYSFHLASAGAPRQEPEGKAPYEANCRKCHGVRGVPPKTMKTKYPKIATFDADFFAAHSQDSVVKVLTNGKGENMKSFKEKLTREQMVAVAQYIKSFVPTS